MSRDIGFLKDFIEQSEGDSKKAIGYSQHPTNNPTDDVTRAARTSLGYQSHDAIEKVLRARAKELKDVKTADDLSRHDEIVKKLNELERETSVKMKALEDDRRNCVRYGVHHDLYMEVFTKAHQVGAELQKIEKKIEALEVVVGTENVDRSGVEHMDGHLTVRTALRNAKQIDEVKKKVTKLEGLKEKIIGDVNILFAGQNNTLKRVRALEAQQEKSDKFNNHKETVEKLIELEEKTKTLEETVGTEDWSNCSDYNLIQSVENIDQEMENCNGRVSAVSKQVDGREKELGALNSKTKALEALVGTERVDSQIMTHTGNVSWLTG